jgi:hypothetical protein
MSQSQGEAITKSGRSDHTPGRSDDVRHLASEAQLGQDHTKGPDVGLDGELVVLEAFKRRPLPRRVVAFDVRIGVGHVPTCATS